jgi:hypothetical protein
MHGRCQVRNKKIISIVYAILGVGEIMELTMCTRTIEQGALSEGGKWQWRSTDCKLHRAF